MATDKKVELISFTANSFRGIDKTSSLFVDFSQRKKGEGFTEMSGNAGVGKTSGLTGIAYSIGARFGLKIKQLINRIDGVIDEETVFSVDGEKYKIEVETRGITVKKQIGEEKWSAKAVEDTPEAFIKDTFGMAIFIPGDVQYWDGKKQIGYMQETFASGDDAGKKMSALEVEADRVFNERTDANRDVKNLSTSLELEPLYKDYENSLKRFEKPVNASKEKAKFDELSNKKTAYEKYFNTLEVARGELSDIKNSIADLEKKLSEAKKKEAEFTASVERGEAWLTANKTVLKEYEEANNNWINLSKTLSDYDKWKELLKKEKELFAAQERASEKDARLSEIRQEILKLTKRYLPKIPGLSIEVAAGLDKTKAQEGVFYNVPGKKEKQPIHELSESEYEDMWLLILEAVDAKFVFIENMNRFGTNVVNTCNRIVKNGGNVFYSIMDRSQKELSISFKSKIS